MKTAAQLALRLRPRIASCAPSPARLIHASAARTANVAPVVGTGPPPEPPVPAAGTLHERVARRRKQAEMLKSAKDIRAARDGKDGGGFKRRFWKDVSVAVVDGRSIFRGGVDWPLVLNMCLPGVRSAASFSRCSSAATSYHEKNRPHTPFKTEPGHRARNRMGCPLIRTTSHKTTPHPPDEPRLPRPRHRSRRRIPHPRGYQDPHHHRDNSITLS